MDIITKIDEDLKTLYDEVYYRDLPEQYNPDNFITYFILDTRLKNFSGNTAMTEQFDIQIEVISKSNPYNLFKIISEGLIEKGYTILNPIQDEIYKRNDIFLYSKKINVRYINYLK